jgi:phage terminase small subunit
MAKKLTMKQKEFAAKYVENNGNGTQAALEVYDTVDAKTAGVIAAENLAKPSICEEIESIQEQSRRSLHNAIAQTTIMADAIAQLHKDITSDNIERRYSALSMLKEYLKLVQSQPQQTINDNRKAVFNYPRQK